MYTLLISNKYSSIEEGAYSDSHDSMGLIIIKKRT